jgi:protein-disulfide isomerase
MIIGLDQPKLLTKGEFMKFISFIFFAASIFSPSVFAGGQELFPTKGAGHPDVTIVEFSDFQCPYCAKGAATMDHLLAFYGEKLQLVHRNMPLPVHPEAEPAARAGVCAFESGRFWEMHDLLFQNQAQLSHSLYVNLASRLGMNASSFEACLDSQEAANAIQVDLADAKKFQILGAPGFILVSKNRTVKVTGSLPLEDFKAKIDDLISNP